MLGLEHATSRRPFDPSGTEVELPQGLAALVGLYGPDDSLIGLALVPGDRDRTVIEVSPTSTAHALVALSPDVLRPDLDKTLANIEVIAQDPAMEALVAAIATTSNLTLPNAEVEAAYAAIADRVPAQRPPSDQGCDSIADPRVCRGRVVCPTQTDRRAHQQQARPMVVGVRRGDGWASLCTAIGPCWQRPR